MKSCDPQKLSEEKAFNESLVSNQNQLKQVIEQQKKDYDKLKNESEKRIRELEEDVLDLYRHLEIVSDIQKLGEESKNVYFCNTGNKKWENRNFKNINKLV